MTLTEAIISGFVQGITEFFPVSSSGHLVLLHYFFGLEEPQIAFDVILHIGTVLAVVAVFWRDIVGIIRSDRLMMAYLGAATAVTFALALISHSAIERFFTSPRLVAMMLAVTGVWLVAAHLVSGRFEKRGAAGSVGVGSSLVIGIAQGIALIPGISRSGATIATGMMLGIKRERALKFSFLLSVPAILGAAVFKACDIRSALEGGNMPVFAAGGITAMLTGFFAIKALIRLVEGRKLALFGIYCIIVSVAGLIWIR